MAGLLAMRRLQFADIERFLDDADPRIVREAARAINDAPVNGATLALARHQPRDWSDPVIAARVINANLRSGTMTHARRLASLGADAAMPNPVREDALLALADWGEPSGRDRVTGVWRPLIASSRDSVVPATALEPHVAKLLENGPEPVQLAAIEAVARLELSAAAPRLQAIVQDAAAAEAVRIAALNALETLAAPELAEALDAAAGSDRERLAGSASRVRARTGLGDVLAQIRATLESGSIVARQNAIRSLADVKSDDADQLIAGLLEELRADRLPPELAVDVLQAATARDSEQLASSVQAIETGDGGPLAPYRFALKGGNPEAGRRIFHEREDVACLRCHQVGGTGAELGPAMDGLAARVSPEYILASIVTPNSTIAPGFENLMIETTSGDWYSGIIKSENATELVLNSPEDGLITLDPATIKTRERGVSGMPEGMNLILSREDLRDLIAFLLTLK
jgi:quinoprotein glucose dehydrogenase